MALTNEQTEELVIELQNLHIEHCENMRKIKGQISSLTQLYENMEITRKTYEKKVQFYSDKVFPKND